MAVRRQAELIGLSGASIGQAVIAIILLLCAQASDLPESDITFATFFGCQFFGFLFVTVPTGVCCAWLAHFWFDRSSISVARMTVVLVIIADLTMIGWILVMLSGR